MATFVVEDGTGKTDANAYISYADANTYWDNHGSPTDWTGASQADREEAIRMATQYLDLLYGTKWRGVKDDDDQALDWPRYGAADNNDYVYDSDEIPTALKDATCEAALRHITETNGLMPDISEPGIIKSHSVQVGPIKEAITYMGGRSQVKKFRIIQHLVQELIHPSMELRRA